MRELHLDNGMKLLLVHQPESTTVVAGWMVNVGSADDPADLTGLSHLLEHMMFKGTETVGTRDFNQERVLLKQIDSQWEQRSSLQARLEKAPPKKQSRQVQQIETLSSELVALQKQAELLAYQGEFSFLYSEKGGTGLDANTLQDMTLYFVTLPAENLELWFWLETDRLLNPVFRQFHKEVGVIFEERRLRIESTPTGSLDERVRALFWGDHPYSWNPMGQANHLVSASRSDAIDFFSRHYRAGNLTAALVGGFDIDQVERWARIYFGQLPRSEAREPLDRRVDPATFSQKRFEETCNCPPQARVLYPTTRFGEEDNYALQLLSAIMNGRTGRLYRDLVLDRQIAFSAFTQQTSWRLGGQFTYRAESKGAADPEILVEAWDAQLSRLMEEVPSQEETDRARNRLTADAFRSLKDPRGLLKQVLIYQGLGDWRYLNHWSRRLGEVTPEQITAVAAKYLVPERRTVAIYRRADQSSAASRSTPDNATASGKAP